MPITYYVDYPCEVKELVPPGRMLRLLYGMERANEAMNKARKADPAATAAEVKVSLSLKGRDRTGQLKVATVAEVTEQFSELGKLAARCDGCRARIESTAFGCRSRIDFPFSMKAEALLMSRIHDSHGDPSGSMLCNYLENNGITGNKPAEMRNLPGVFFESDKPLVRRLEDGRRISSNQIFELLFLTEQISPNHCRFLLGMLDMLEPRLPLDRDLAGLPNLFVVQREDLGMPVARIGLKLTRADDEDDCTHQLIGFFGALLFGTEFQNNVWVKV